MSIKNALQIRLGTIDDLAEVADVFTDSVRNLCNNDYDATTIEQWLASRSPESRLAMIEKNSLWVAVLENEIVGYLIIAPGEIIALFIRSNYSGHGIGSTLLKFGIDMARQTGIETIKLQSTLTAVPFYTKYGFRKLNDGFYTYNETNLNLPIVNMILP